MICQHQRRKVLQYQPVLKKLLLLLIYHQPVSIGKNLIFLLWSIGTKLCTSQCKFTMHYFLLHQGKSTAVSKIHKLISSKVACTNFTWLRLDYRLSIINISFAVCELIAFKLLIKWFELYSSNFSGIQFHPHQAFVLFDESGLCIFKSSYFSGMYLSVYLVSPSKKICA